MVACFRGRTADGRRVVIPSPKEIHDVSAAMLQTYPGHLAEIEGLYAEVVPAMKATDRA